MEDWELDTCDADDFWDNYDSDDFCDDYEEPMPEDDSSDDYYNQ